MTECHLDVETRSAADLRKVGAPAYAEHETTEVVCACYAFDDGPIKTWRMGEPCPADIRAHAESGGVFWAWNAAFEMTIWDNVLAPRNGWPPLGVRQWKCAMVLAYAAALPGALENAAAAIGLEVRKDMQGRNLMLRMARPKGFDANGAPQWFMNAEAMDRLVAYCETDVEVERTIHGRLLDLLPQEQELWWLDATINSRGIFVDIPAIDRAMEIVEEAKKRLDREMKRVTGGWVSGCTKVGDLTDWLHMHGVEIDGVAKADVTELLARDDLPDVCRQALLLRRDAAKSSTAKLKAMRQGASRDGRCRGTLQYHGAGTGRWAGRRVQFQNVPRPSIGFGEIEEVLDMLGGQNG